MALATLSIDIEARLAKLQAGLDKAGHLAEQQAGRMNRAFSGVSTALKGIGGAVAAAFAGGAIAHFVADANRGLLAIKDLSEATGASIENISALENVARAAGGSIAEVSGILVKFNGALKDAGRTKEVATALQALGLDFARLRELDPAEALRQTAVALERFADDGNKARITQELFGRSVRDAAPYLKELAEQTRLQGTVTESAVEEADKFNKQLARLRQNAEDAARSLSGPLVSALNEIIDKTRANGIEGFFDALNNSALGKRLGVDDVARYRREVDSLTETLGRLEAAQRGARSDNKARYQPAIDETRAELERVQRAFQRTTDVQGGRGRLLPEFVRPSLTLPPDPGRTATPGRAGKQDIPYAITDPLADTRQLFLQTEKDYEAVDAMLRKLSDSAREYGNAITDPLDAQRQAFLQTEKDYEAVDKALAKLQDSANKTSNIGADLGMTFASAFEDAIVNGAKLSDVLRGLEKDIVRIITRRLVTEPLADAVSGFLKPATGGGGIDFGSIISKLAGSFFGGFADGGYLPAGRWGIAGEDGPEPIFGGRTGKTVVPNRAAGGGMTVVNHFHLSGPADMRTQQQISAAAGRGVQQAMARNL